VASARIILSKGEKLLSGLPGKLFAVNSIIAAAYAFILPIMNIYLIDGLKAAPSFIAVYNISYIISGICFSQWFGFMADRGISERVLFTISVFCIVLSALTFSVLNRPWQTLLIGVLLMGPGNACIPLILSMIQRFAEQSKQDVAKVNAQMRAGVSIVWIVGPAVAFLVSDFWGYRLSFVLAAIFALVGLLLSQRYLTRHDFGKTKATKDQDSPRNFTSKTVWLLSAVILFGNYANHVHLTAMPLYITQELKLPVYFPGVLMALSAFTEIPVMLLAGSSCEKYGKNKIMLFGFVFAAIYYSLLQTTTSIAGLLLIQILNAIYYGIFIGLGVTIVQEMFPTKVGFASAYYANLMRIGMMLGSSCVGMIAQYSSFKIALYASLLSAVMVLPILVCTRK
jgi:MFS transporter, SET family, sugar efflux transporter